MSFTTLYMLVEGQSELEFANLVLLPRFNSERFGVRAIINPTSPGRRGGGLKYSEICARICGFLHEPNTYATTFFDLYGLPGSFPRSDKTTPHAKAADIERQFYDDVVRGFDGARGRFFPHIQPHELESLFFSDICAIVSADAHCQPKTARQKLERILREFGGNPELINTAAAPSKRLNDVFNPYQKVLMAGLISGRLSAEKIGEKCPHFRAWCEKISQIKQANG